MKPNEWLFDAIGCVEDSFLDQTEKSIEKSKNCMHQCRVSLHSGSLFSD